MSEPRIFLYEYNATALYGNDRDTFIGKANELPEAIQIERGDAGTRPIIFLGHSIGGISSALALAPMTGGADGIMLLYDSVVRRRRPDLYY